MQSANLGASLLSHQFINQVEQLFFHFPPYICVSIVLSFSSLHRIDSSNSYISRHLQIKHFCNDENDGPTENIHNKESPNEHNRLCNQRSVWDVIKYSTDFHDSNTSASINNPVDVNDTTPQFEIIQHQNSSKNFVLVLDSSGSMSGVNGFGD